MSTKTEETALTVKKDENYELSESSMVATATAEVQAAIIIAKKFPRNEDESFRKLMRACNRSSFAGDAAYSFPRGTAKVKGPSINLAREAARVWGNIEYGILIVHDDDDMRKIKAWAWDKESNSRSFAEDTFKKLIFRKKGGWVKPDERDLRELTNRRGAILKRNCLLELLPKDLVEDALSTCEKTLRANAAQDPDSARKAIILAFSELNITPEMLEKKLGHKIAQCIPDEIAELRQIHQSIKDGNSKWSEYIETDNGGNGGNGNKKAEKGSLSMDDLKPKKTTFSEPKTSKEELEERLNIHFGGDIDARGKWFLEKTGKATVESLTDDQVKGVIGLLVDLMGS
jgi:hypothetical protein